MAERTRGHPALARDPRPARRHADARGFTLLEVLVALVIALPALLLLYRQGVLAVGVTQSATLYDQAVSRAQSRLDALVDAALTPGDREGDDGGGFHWRTHIEPLATLLPAPGGVSGASGGSARGAYAGGTTLYAISVALTWPPGGARSVVLRTRRLGPAPG